VKAKTVSANVTAGSKIKTRKFSYVGIPVQLLRLGIISSCNIQQSVSNEAHGNTEWQKVFVTLRALRTAVNKTHAHDTYCQHIN
jgi:hypothetical protein